MKKSFDYKGAIKGVRVEINSNKGKKVITTGIDGAFEIPLAHRTIYTVMISKQGYSSIMIKINTSKVPHSYFTDLNRFQGSEFILVKGDEYPNIQNLGDFSYSSSKKNFSFTPAKVSNENWVKNNILLAEKSVVVNHKPFQRKPKPVPSAQIAEDTTKAETNIEQDSVLDDTRHIMEDLKKVEDFLMKSDSLSLDQVEEYVKIIGNLKDKIKAEKDGDNAASPMTTMLIANLEAEIRFIEAQLHKSKELIDLKESQIRQSQNIILLGALLGLIMIGALIYVILSLRFRKAQNSKLETQNQQIINQNRRITDSLLFSASIQHAIFKSRERFKSLFNEGVIFFKPKDIVSGDFYWFEEINGVKIIAVADCTGHGVPGALLTMLGNSFLNEIVKISKVIDPAEIVSALNMKLIETFSDERNQRGIHGMDISIIAVDTSKKELKYAGAMNSIYQITNGNAIEHNTSLISLGMTNEVAVETKVLQYEKEDCFYLFSDGYSDQFGGDNNEKLNKAKFETVLLSASNSFNEGEDVLSDYFSNWKRDNNQIDDVLILGFKV